MHAETIYAILPLARARARDLIVTNSILSLVTTRRSHRSIRNDIEDNMYRLIVYIVYAKIIINLNDELVNITVTLHAERNDRVGGIVLHLRLIKNLYICD